MVYGRGELVYVHGELVYVRSKLVEMTLGLAPEVAVFFAIALRLLGQARRDMLDALETLFGRHKRLIQCNVRIRMVSILAISDNRYYVNYCAINILD